MKISKKEIILRVKINKATSATLFADIIEFMNPSNEELSLTA